MLPRDLVQQIETINGHKLDDEQLDEIVRWQKGRDLAHVVNSPGWDVVLEILSSYADKEAQRCINTDPGNEKAVLAAHAVAFAASRIFTLFVEDVQNCVNLSRTVPVAVMQNMKNSPVPPESL